MYKTKKESLLDNKPLFLMLWLFYSSATFAQYTTSGTVSPPTSYFNNPQPINYGNGPQPVFFRNAQGGMEYGNATQSSYFVNQESPMEEGLPPIQFFGNPEGPPEDDDPALPINNYLWMLSILGLGLGAFKMQTQPSKKKSTQSPLL